MPAAHEIGGGGVLDAPVGTQQMVEIDLGNRCGDRLFGIDMCIYFEMIVTIDFCKCEFSL
jgi:hypothetical protein